MQDFQVVYRNYGHWDIWQNKEGLRQDWCFEKNKSKLDKCVLLCANCHKKLHAGVISI